MLIAVVISAGAQESSHARGYFSIRVAGASVSWDETLTEGLAGHFDFGSISEGPYYEAFNYQTVFDFAESEPLIQLDYGQQIAVGVASTVPLDFSSAAVTMPATDFLRVVVEIALIGDGTKGRDTVPGMIGFIAQNGRTVSFAEGVGPLNFSEMRVDEELQFVSGRYTGVLEMTSIDLDSFDPDTGEPDGFERGLVDVDGSFRMRTTDDSFRIMPLALVPMWNP